MTRKTANIDTIGWFASATDVCKVLATLSSRAHIRPEAAALLDILALNRPIDLASTVWPYMGSKSGAVAGVASYSGVLRRDDDREFVIVIGYSNPMTPVDEDRMSPLVWRSFELLAAHDR